MKKVKNKSEVNIKDVIRDCNVEIKAGETVELIDSIADSLMRKYPWVNEDIEIIDKKKNVKEIVKDEKDIKGVADKKNSKKGSKNENRK